MTRNFLSYAASAILGTVFGIATLAVVPANNPAGSDVACNDPHCGNDAVIEVACDDPSCRGEAVIEVACCRPDCSDGQTVPKNV